MNDRVLLQHCPDDRNGMPKGTWHRTTSGYVFITCAICGHLSVLRDSDVSSLRADGTHGHDIEPDGTVMPSIMCPHQCPWHVYGKLVGWSLPRAAG